MREDIGRFFEGHILETVNLIKSVYDIATGQGADVSVWVHGRELVFARGEPGSGPGFVRVLPADTMITVAFPRGMYIFDPKKRMKGVPGSRTRVVIRATMELDSYVRRLIEAAYALES